LETANALSNNMDKNGVR